MLADCCHSVGNVPYNMGEDQLIDVFKSVGQVIGFRYCDLAWLSKCEHSYQLKLFSRSVQISIWQRNRKTQRLWLLWIRGYINSFFCAKLLVPSDLKSVLLPFNPSKPFQSPYLQSPSDVKFNFEPMLYFKPIYSLASKLVFLVWRASKYTNSRNSLCPMKIKNMCIHSIERALCDRPAATQWPQQCISLNRSRNSSLSSSKFEQYRCGRSPFAHRSRRLGSISWRQNYCARRTDWRGYTRTVWTSSPVARR